MKKNYPLIQNKRANFDYFIEEKLQCGIALSGNEVKSIKAGMCNLTESWCEIKNNQLIINNMHISKYDPSNKFDVDERRTRTLLAHKNEIRKFAQKIKEKGYTLVPIKLYWDRNLCKIDIGLAKGKHTYDKRETIKRNDIKRESDRELARY